MPTRSEDYAIGYKFSAALGRLTNAKATLEGYRETLRKIREDLPRAELELLEAKQDFEILKASL